MPDRVDEVGNASAFVSQYAQLRFDRQFDSVSAKYGASARDLFESLTNLSDYNRMPVG